MSQLIRFYWHATWLTLTRQPLTLKRVSSVFGIASLLFPIRAVVAAGRAVDEFLFPGYKTQSIREPLYIIANPRSGTTFLHHLLSLDEERFTSFRLWQALLPSVTLYKLVSEVLAPIDGSIGQPIGRVLTAIERLGFGGWDTMHPTGLRRLEEPEALWIYAGLTPSMCLLFPFMEEMRYLNFLDRAGHRLSGRAVEFYVESIRRHLYALGPDKTFLNKEVFFTGRFTCVAPVLPDARYVHIVRHPYEAIPSFLNMFSVPWHFHSPEIGKRSEQTRRLALIVFDYYDRMLDIRHELPADRFMTIRYDALVADPIGAVEKIYDRFDMEMTPLFRHRLLRASGEPRGEQSEHRYSLAEFGLTKEDVYSRLTAVFDAYGFER